jgi:hypothetical protein
MLGLKPLSSQPLASLAAPTTAEVVTASSGEAAAATAWSIFGAVATASAGGAAYAIASVKFKATVQSSELAGTAAVMVVLNFIGTAQTASAGGAVVHVWAVNPNRDPIIFTPLRTGIRDPGRRTVVILQEISNG